MKRNLLLIGSICMLLWGCSLFEGAQTEAYLEKVQKNLPSELQINQKQFISIRSEATPLYEQKALSTIYMTPDSNQQSSLCCMIAQTLVYAENQELADKIRKKSARETRFFELYDGKQLDGLTYYIGPDLSNPSIAIDPDLRNQQGKIYKIWIFHYYQNKNIYEILQYVSGVPFKDDQEISAIVHGLYSFLDE